MARFIPDPKTHPITGVRRFALDAAAMLVYITLVYVWALRLHPLGRDYGMMAAPHFMPFATGRILEWEMRVFGGSPTGYHLVSLGFLYACMLAVYRLTRLTVQSYFWLGTLAAVLFMANPVHSEAVLNLTGISDLVPALLALLALVAYASHAAAPRLWRFGAALVLFACAVMPYSTNLFLIVVLLLFEVFIRGKERRLMRLLPFALLSLPMWWLQRDLLSDSLHPNHMLPPLYLVFYPIGLLPSTARTFYEIPALGWLAAGVVVFLLWLLARKVRRPAFLFGIFAMAATRLFQPFPEVDPVHMIGGGQLLLATAFFNIALITVFRRMMDHPKWQRPVIVWTTLLALVFFCVQIRSIRAWNHAGQVVKQFQAEAEAAQQTIGILPDYQFYRGAPMCLSESIAYDTPFSARLPAQSLLRLHYVRSARHEVSITNWTAQRGEVTITAPAVVDLLDYRRTFHGPTEINTEELQITAERPTDERLSFVITPKDDALPRCTLPARIP